MADAEVKRFIADLRKQYTKEELERITRELEEDYDDEEEEADTVRNTWTPRFW